MQCNQSKYSRDNNTNHSHQDRRLYIVPYIDRMFPTTDVIPAHASSWRGDVVHAGHVVHAQRAPQYGLACVKEDICIQESKTSTTLPIQKGDDRKRPPQNEEFDFMSCRIPRKKLRPGHVAIPYTPSLVVASLKSTTTKVISDRKQFKYVKSKHDQSTAPFFGEANLFFQIEDEPRLELIEISKRCIKSSDCIQGQTYMDTTSFSNVLKRKECPLVAYSFNGRKYMRGYLLRLNVRRTIIVRLKNDGSFYPGVPDFFNPMDTTCTLDIKYINLVDATMDSSVDGFLCSKTCGPDSIKIGKLLKLRPDLEKYFDPDPISAILTVPKQLTNVKRAVTPQPFNSTMNPKGRKNVSRVGVTCLMQPESDCVISEVMWKGKIAFTSPDDHSYVYFLTFDEAKKLIDREVLDRRKYLEELKSKKKFRIKVNVMEVDEKDGLTLVVGGSDSNKVGIPSKCEPRVQNYKYEGDIAAQYTIQERINVKDLEGLLFLVHEVLNGASTVRTCTNHLGLSLNKGITTSSRPRIDPRKDQVTKKESERLTASRMKCSLAPLLFEIIKELARYSQDVSKSLDPVVQYAYSKVYEAIIRSKEGKELMRSNLDLGMNLNSIQILTFPDRSGRNFANSCHVDRFDSNKTQFNRVMENMLGKEIEALCKARTKSSNNRKRNDQLDEHFEALLYLIKLGIGVGREEDEEVCELKFESETTCGYLPLYTGKEKRDVFTGFLFPKNRTLVRFRESEVTFQRWKSRSVSHMTPVSYSYDKKNVFLKDKGLTVLAWGGGGSSKRVDFLAEQNINYNGPSIRGPTQLCQILRNNGGTRRQFQRARDRFPSNQRCITSFYRRHYNRDL